MKTINLTAVKVREVLLQPESDTPLVVLCELLDGAGVAVLHKRVAVKRENMPAAATSAITALIARITDRITTLELT